MSKWISVEERVPDNDRYVLFSLKNRYSDDRCIPVIGYYSHRYNSFLRKDEIIIEGLFNVTHWQDFTDPDKETE